MPFRRRYAVAAFSAVVLASAGTYAYAAQPTSKPVSHKELRRPSRSMSEKSISFDRHTVLVKFKRGTSATAENKALSAHGAHSLGMVGGSSFVKVRTDGAAPDVVKALKRNATVERVSLNYQRHISATPNDPGYPVDQKQYLSTIRAPQAWDVTKGSTTQVIAVVDTGVNASHEDLAGRTVAGYNVLTGNATSTDDNGHGTMVAGIAAANTNNAKGIAGVAWTGKVMPVKVLDSQGNGFDADIATGVYWAADHGAKIINLSLGGPGANPVLQDAIHYATATRGAVVVVAAGNSGDATPQYPAAYPEVLSVGATDASGYLTDFSSYGTWLDIAAPGFGIVGPAYNGNTSYFSGDGTSFAAPIVSGVAALVRSRYTTLTPAQVIAKIEGAARDAGPRGIDPYYGHGVVDAYAAVGGGWGAEFPQRALGANEPNDVPARATAFTTSITGTMAAEGDVDWYRYTSAGAQPLSFMVTPAAFDPNWPQNFDPIITVYDKDLKKIGTIDDSAPGAAETLSFRAGAGDYYIAVTSFNGAADTRPYTLSAFSGATGAFAPYQATGVGSWPEAVTVGDVTGDGRPDVLMTTSSGYDPDPADDYKLWVFVQQPDGTLAGPVSYATALQLNDSYFAGLAVLDADGDGRTDVALATSSGVQIFGQTGTGTLADAGLLPGTSGARQVVAADIDRDGDTDLVMGGASGLKLLAHQPDGTFTVSAITGATFAAVKVGDVDGDGKPDVVGLSDTTVNVYHQTDSGWTTSSHAVGSTVAWDIEVADMTGDGKSDVVASVPGKSPNAKISLLAQNAAGGLNAPVLSTVRDYPESFGAADITGDSRPDLVVTHGGHNALSLIPQGSTGGLGTPQFTPLPFADDYNPQGIAFGDINGDGRVDAVVADHPDGLVTLVNGAPVPGVQPWVRNVSTPDFATGVPQNVTPTVTFGRPVDPASVTSTTVKLVSGVSGADVPATPAFDAASNSVTITPSAALQDNTPYRIVVSGLTDSAGAAQTDPYTSTFRTVNVAPPAVTGLKATGAVGSATLTWTRPSITDMDVVVVRMAAGATPPATATTGTAVYSANGSSVTASGLAAGTGYAFSVWVRDRSGKYSPVQTTKLIGTALTVSSNTVSPTYGYTLTVTGKLTRTDTKAGVAGVPVQLYGRRKGTTTWSALGTATSSSTGVLSLKHMPTWSLDYRWILRGSTTYAGSASALRSVGVHTAVTGTLSTTAIRLGSSLSLYGSVKPSHAGKTVYLQRYSGGMWTNVTSRTLSASSGFNFGIKPSARGTYTYRIYMPADTDHLSGYSPNRSFTVS